MQLAVFLLAAAGATMIFNGCADNTGGGNNNGGSESIVKPTNKGYALAIGLYKVDPAHYDGWEGELFGCEPDAIDMENIAVSQGLNAEKLLTSQATRDAVLAKLNVFANILESGDLLVVSYSGHGGQLPDQNGDEQDGLDETWCLYDGQLLDDELYEAWAKFRSGVRILVFSDSCHSHTVLRMTRGDMINPPPARIIELNRISNKKLIPMKMDRLELISRPEMRKAITERPELRKAVKSVPPSARKPIDSTVPEMPPPPEIKAERIFVSRAMPWQVSQRTYMRNKTFYDGVGNAAPKEDPDQVKASVILISGCLDNQYSSDIGYNGLFTWKLKEVWGGGAFTGDHRKFQQDIRERVMEMNPDQAPDFFTVGTGTETFSKQKPYEVITQTD
jgi:hypothetical protein